MYDGQLKQIISKYGYQAMDMIDSTQIHNIIIGVFRRRCHNKKTAIWGIGRGNTINSHAAVIVKKYSIELNGLEYLIESYPDLQGKELLGLPIIAPEEIAEKGIEIVIIGSKASAKSICENLAKVAPNCEYLDIYEELAKFDIVIDYNFFNECNVYTELYKNRMEYERAESIPEKEKTLHALISRYLQIRDFSYAWDFARIYCKEKYNGYLELEQMLKEIGELISAVKSRSQNRKEDVVVHLIDSLRAVDVFEAQGGKVKLQMFAKYQEHMSILEQAYSTGPCTYESMSGITKQKLPFEDNVYEKDSFLIQYEDFKLLTEVEKMGMNINLYVASDYSILKDNPKINKKEQLHMSEKLWNLVCDMTESDSRTFNLIYYPWELHFPMLCGFHRQEPQCRHFSDVGIEDMKDFIEIQFSDCKHYVDRQFDYYKDFFNDEMIQIFMGDHSQPVFDMEKEKPFFMYYADMDKVSHIAFLIYSSKFASQNYPQLVTMLDFNRIMIALIKEQKISIPQRDLIQYQYYNVQNRKLRAVAKELGYMDYTEGISCFASKEYLYVKTATGVEEVYRLPEIETNIVESKEGQNFISYVKDNYETEFPGFWTIQQEA